MNELWYAGDKVKLTGSHWGYGTTDRATGDTLTLKRAVAGYDEWECEEVFDGENLIVQMGEHDAWGAVKVEDGPLVPKPGGEVRTTSSTGGEKGVKPEAYALIPWEAMDEVARVYNAGAEKYAAHNWRRGYEWSKSFSAACRHLFAFWRGEDRDPELGTLHLANAAFHILGMIAFALNREKYGNFDDRYVPDSE